MRFTICVIVMLLTAALFCAAAHAFTEQEAASVYNKAGSLYRDNRFGESLAQYESLIDADIANPDLFYNASNAAYRNGQLGKALLYIERTLRLSPSDEDALANRAFLNSVKTDQETAGDNAVLTFLTARYNRVTINHAALLSGISFAVALLLLTSALFVAAWKRTLLIGFSSALLLVFLITTGVLIQKTQYLSTVTEGIVMQEEVSAYSGPDTGNTHIFTIHEGTKVVIERTQNDWSLIRLRSGAGGWIPSETIGII